MRLSDEMPMDPDVLADLEVIDLTLAGEPVDPESAELAELALMLQMERAEPSAEFRRLLDARATQRFAAPVPPRAGAQRPPSGRWSWLQHPGFRVGLVGVAAAAAVVVFVASNRGTESSNSALIPSAGSQNSRVDGGTSGPGIATNGAASASTTASGGAGAAASTLSQGASHTASRGAASSPSARSDLSPLLSSPKAASDASSTASKSAAGTPAGVPYGAADQAALAPAPNTSGRKVIQSAQLTLSAGNARINTVSQEVFDVVSQQHGIVESSHITSVAGKNGGTANFRLSIPSANLEPTLQSMSTLRYAHVVSRSNTTQDVTKTYRSDKQRLQDAQALRTSLLKQLALATTQTQIDSLNAQIRDAEGQIGNAQYVLKHLQHRVSYSSLNVQLYSGNAPIVRPVHQSGGFTLGGAAHDAGRVLVVAAGVILIGAAGLVPVALLAALLLWIVEWLRGRRREQALDQA